ncbi:hypothetical protein BU15DRAFT_42382, partial [Melanogaster broomeanus]
RARQIEGMLLRMAQSGQLREKVSEAQLIELLEQVSTPCMLQPRGPALWHNGLLNYDCVLDGRGTEQVEYNEDYNSGEYRNASVWARRVAEGGFFIVVPTEARS